MLKSLRAPEGRYGLVMWFVSLIFAGFLIGLGREVVGRLPGVDQAVTLESHIPPEALAKLRSDRVAVNTAINGVERQRDITSTRLTAAQNEYRAARETFDTWIATRTATTDPQQDPEVLRRQRGVDLLKSNESVVQAEVDRLDSQLVVMRQSLDSLSGVQATLEETARPAFERELFVKELMVFVIRLMMTLPLLVVAGWLIAKKRKNEYWPLARGFVLFALFAFFFELVPYLPSYGGYVRYGVGVVGTLLAGVYVIRAMRRYLAKRQAAEQQSAVERQRTLGYEEAIRKMSTGVCPGCERPIAGGLQSPSNFCVHCGLNLFDNCGTCNTRKNAFFQYCPSCGLGTEARANATGMGTEARANATGSEHLRTA